MKKIKKYLSLVLSLCLLFNGSFTQIALASDETTLFGDASSEEVTGELDPNNSIPFQNETPTSEKSCLGDEFTDETMETEIFTDETSSETMPDEEVVEECEEPVEFTVSNGGALDKSVMTILEQSDTGFKVKFRMTDGNEFIYSFQSYSKETFEKDTKKASVEGTNLSEALFTDSANGSAEFANLPASENELLRGSTLDIWEDFISNYFEDKAIETCDYIVSDHFKSNTILGYNVYNKEEESISLIKIETLDDYMVDTLLERTIGEFAPDVHDFFIDNVEYVFHREQIKNSIKMSNMSDNEKEWKLKEINNLGGAAEAFMIGKLVGSCLQGVGISSGNLPVLAVGTVIKYFSEELLERNIAGVEKRAYNAEQEEGPEIFTDVEIKAGETYQFTFKNSVYNFNCESNGVIYDSADYSPYGGASTRYAEKMAPGKGNIMAIGGLASITVKSGTLKIKNLSNKKVTYKRGKQEAVTKIVLNAGATFECKDHKRKSCVDLEPYNADYFIYSGLNGRQEESLQNSNTDTTRWLYFADDILKVHVTKGKVILRYATLLLQDASISISGNHSSNMDRSYKRFKLNYTQKTVYPGNKFTLNVTNIIDKTNIDIYAKYQSNGVLSGKKDSKNDYSYIFTAQKPGTCLITIGTKDDNKKGGDDFEQWCLVTVIPPAVKNLSLKATHSNSIQIKWTSIGYKDYYIYRSTNGKDFVRIGENSRAEYTDKDITPGKMYYYKVYYYENKTWSKPSNTLSVIARPKNVKLTDVKKKKGGVTVEWTPSKYSHGYIIEARPVGSSKYKRVATVRDRTISAYDITSGLTANKEYDFRMKAYVKRGSKTCYSEKYSNVKRQKVLPAK